MSEYKDTPDNKQAPAGAPQEPKNRKEEVKQWHSRIAKREAFRNKVAADYKWDLNKKRVKGMWELSANQDELDIPPINLFFAYLKTELPSLYSKDPHIKVNPKNAQSVASSRIMELVINYLWRVKKLKREVKKAIADAISVSHGWIKSGYTANFGIVEDGEGQAQETIQNEDFFAYRTPYDCVLFDSESIDPPFDSSWIAFKVFMPIDAAKNHPLWNKSLAQKLQMVTKKDGETSALKEYESDGAMTVVYEIWDKKAKKVCILGQGVEEDYLHESEWPYKMKGFPVSFLCFNPINDEPYGVPDLFMGERQVLEKIKMRAMELEHVKSLTRQFIAVKGALDDDAKEAYREGYTGQVIEVTAPNNDLSKVFQPLPYPQVQIDIWPLEDRVDNDLMNVWGQTPSERGGQEKTSTRAMAEIDVRQKGAASRRSEKVDTVEDFVEDIAGNLAALVQQFADVPFYVKVTGKQPQEIIEALNSRPSMKGPDSVTNAQGNNLSGFTFTKEDIQGEFDFEVVAGSTLPVDRQTTKEIVTSILEVGPKIGLLPSGPVMSACLSIFAEQQDLVALEMAVAEEIKMQRDIRDAQKENDDLMTQTTVRDKAIEQQLEAEKISVKDQDSQRKHEAAVFATQAKLHTDKEKNQIDAVSTVLSAKDKDDKKEPK